jgi:hypothetical protein
MAIHVENSFGRENALDDESERKTIPRRIGTITKNEIASSSTANAANMTDKIPSRDGLVLRCEVAYPSVCPWPETFGLSFVIATLSTRRRV